VSRGFLLWFIALFAAYPLLDVKIADWFFDHEAGKFPLSINYELNLVRQFANWVPFLLLLPPLFAELRKLVFPNAPMSMAPSVVLFLIGSFLIGPGLTSNLMLKENWGRPRPNSVQQFAGSAPFEPWWRPSDACKRNCSFVSGEASQAFSTIAPASLAPPQVRRPLALGGALIFGTAVASLRVVFGRHFVSDIVFAGVITILIIVAAYRPAVPPGMRRSGIECFSIALHGGIGALLARAGGALAHVGGTLKETGQNLHNGRRPAPWRGQNLGRCLPSEPQALAEVPHLPIVPAD
jgi:lipid A 4'-phosphatase